MQRCHSGAYEVILSQLSRQRVAMKENPAYVDVHRHRYLIPILNNIASNQEIVMINLGFVYVRRLK